MASRTKQKEEARARRLAEEQARVERERRQRRIQLLIGVVLAAVAVVAVAIAVSAGSSSNSTPAPTSAGAKKSASKVSAQLAGIPQSGTTLGKPSAKVTVTEYGDLQCPICRDFAVGAESSLISNDVRAGKAKLVYKSLETATGNSPTPSIFPAQQAAALAAGNQHHAWDYILLFYDQQGAEGTNYVNTGYLDGLARQTPSLNFSKWSADRNSATFSAQVVADQQDASSKGYNSTPTIVVSGPKGSAKPIVGDTDYGTLASAIKSVQ